MLPWSVIFSLRCMRMPTGSAYPLHYLRFDSYRLAIIANEIVSKTTIEGGDVKCGNSIVEITIKKFSGTLLISILFTAVCHYRFKTIHEPVVTINFLSLSIWFLSVWEFLINWLWNTQKYLIINNTYFHFSVRNEPEMLKQLLFSTAVMYWNRCYGFGVFCQLPRAEITAKRLQQWISNAPDDVCYDGEWLLTTMTSHHCQNSLNK